jgi:hypothetical protein
MRALTVLTVSAFVATALSILFMRSPPSAQSGFRACARAFFQAYMNFAAVFVGGAVDAAKRVDTLANREIFLSIWLIAFVPALFLCAYAVHLWWR